MTKICLHKALLKKGSVGRLALMFIIRTGCGRSAALESFEARLSSMVKRGHCHNPKSHHHVLFSSRPMARAAKSPMRPGNDKNQRRPGPSAEPAHHRGKCRRHEQGSQIGPLHQKSVSRTQVLSSRRVKRHRRQQCGGNDTTDKAETKTQCQSKRQGGLRGIESEGKQGDDDEYRRNHHPSGNIFFARGCPRKYFREY